MQRRLSSAVNDGRAALHTIECKGLHNANPHEFATDRSTRPIDDVISGILPTMAPRDAWCVLGLISRRRMTPGPLVLGEGRYARGMGRVSTGADAVRPRRAT